MYPLPQMAKMSPEVTGFTCEWKRLILHCIHRGAHSSFVFCGLGSSCASMRLSPLWRPVGRARAWGRRSHTVWVPLFFLSDGGSSMAPQQPVIKTLFSPSAYFQSEGHESSSAALQDVRDPRTRARSSQGRFSPWGIWDILNRMKALGLLSSLTLQAKWCTPIPDMHINIDLLHLPALTRP